MPNFSKTKSKSEKVSSDYTAGNASRSAQESAEGSPVVQSSAPKNRFQDKQQLSNVEEAQDVEAASSSFTRKKNKSTGGLVKQEVASRVALSDADFSGPMGSGSTPSRAGLKTISYSGDGGSIIGNAANTPNVGVTDRSGTSGRFEKKLDATNKKINYAASEQVIEEYDNPAPLGESGNEVQGYYGTPKDASARSQKHSGAHPADPLFMRSLDLITKDEIVFINGQYVKDVQVNDYLTPTKSYDSGALDDPSQLVDNYTVDAGNYIPTLMKVTLKGTAAGSAEITAVDFDVEDASITVSDPAVMTAAATNRQIDMNKAEIARQSIDSKAGRETEATWSCLARAIAQPTPTNWLLSTIESEVGATVATAYKFANKAFAYQLNKTAKDGQHLTRPMREMLTGDIADMFTSADYASDGLYGFNPFSDAPGAIAARRNGSAATMGLINSSPNRYSSKADVLTNTQGLRQYFQVADNNMNVFRLKKEFGAALNSVDVFSTIDREYDPLQPICMTDRVGLVYTINPKTYSGFTSSGFSSGFGPFKYAYRNRMSSYNVTVDHPLWKGICNWINQYAGKIFKVLGGSGTSEVTWNIPIHHSTTTLSLFDFLVLAAVPFIQRVRINAMRDVLDYEVNFEYPYDLISIQDFNPMNAVNYNIISHDEPLVSRVMIPSSAIRWVMPEFFWGVGKNTDGSNAGMYVYPWYFSEQQFTPTGSSSGVAYSIKPMNGAMSLPIIRSGVRMSYLDSIYGMTERDLRLCLDRMVCPCVPNSESEAQGENAYMVYKYGQTGDGIPAFKGNITIQQLLSTPRELGWFMSAPHGLLRAADNTDNVSDLTNDGAGFYTTRKLTGSDLVEGNTSFRAYAWYAGTSYPSAILDVDSVNVDRAQAFAQNWDCSPACFLNRQSASNQRSGYKTRRSIGFYLGANAILTSTSSGLTTLVNKSQFTPFTTGLTAAGSPYGGQVVVNESYSKVVSFAPALWGRLQKLCMVISPWDTCDFYPDGASGGQAAAFDPYDGAYYFGMAGTMASDYNQDLFNRVNRVQDQGWLYIKDPFVEASPVFKDGFKYTM